jgi:hypothetical protein
VHPTGGSLRVFGHFLWLKPDSGKVALPRPAHQRVTPAVRQSFKKHGSKTMNDDLLSIELMSELEEAVSKQARERLSDLLAYFQFIQDTLLIAFKNKGNPLKLRNVSDNPKPFVFISTTRAFSISRIAMEITIRGYPMEGMALTRTLLELLESTQYLARHPDFINDYLSGKLKLERVLKMAKLEKTESASNHFGRFWGLMSRYSHASPDLLALPLTSSSGNKISASLVINDIKRIDDTAYGIVGALFMQYFIFSIILRNDFSVTNQLTERDRYIFDPGNIRKYAGLSSMSDEELAQIHSLFSSSETEG